jgi:glycosyltransferase involved in cell wall biosynthesis
MKLVLLTTNLALGGAEKQVAELAARVATHGWIVHVVSLVRPSAFVEDLQAAGITVHSPGLLRIPALIRAMQPDILHAHMFHANMLARILRLVLPIPVIINTIHSLAESSRKSDVIWRRDFAYRITGFLPDVTVAVSQAAADRHIEAKCVNPNRLQVIPNGIDTTLFCPAETRELREFTWLAVGRLHWKKDYSTLLKAFAALERGRLIIAGSGPEEAELRRAAPPGVEFLGQRSDTPELMRHVDAFVLSSVVEGLPVVLLEAAASGLPAVATDAGGVRETQPAFLVPTKDPTALARAMAALMDMSEAQRAELGREARARAVANWDWSVIVERWLKLYRELSAWT